MPGSDRGLPGHLVDASGSGRDGDDGGRVAKSQNLNDFEKNRLKAHEYLGRLWKCIDGMKTISPNAGMYQHFRTCGEKISQLLDTWPRSPEGITDATAPKGSQITNLDIDDF